MTTNNDERNNRIALPGITLRRRIKLIILEINGSVFVYIIWVFSLEHFMIIIHITITKVFFEIILTVDQ